MICLSYVSVFAGYCSPSSSITGTAIGNVTNRVTRLQHHTLYFSYSCAMLYTQKRKRTQEEKKKRTQTGTHMARVYTHKIKNACANREQEMQEAGRNRDRQKECASRRGRRQVESRQTEGMRFRQGWHQVECRQPRGDND